MMIEAKGGKELEAPGEGAGGPSSPDVVTRGLWPPTRAPRESAAHLHLQHQGRKRHFPPCPNLRVVSSRKARSLSAPTTSASAPHATSFSTSKASELPKIPISEPELSPECSARIHDGGGSLEVSRGRDRGRGGGRELRLLLRGPPQGPGRPQESSPELVTSPPIPTAPLLHPLPLPTPPGQPNSSPSSPTRASLWTTPTATSSSTSPPSPSNWTQVGRTRHGMGQWSWRGGLVQR